MLDYYTMLLYAELRHQQLLEGAGHDRRVAEAARGQRMELTSRAPHMPAWMLLASPLGAIWRGVGLLAGVHDRG